MPFDVFTKFSDWLCNPQYIPGQFFKHIPPQNSAKKTGRITQLEQKVAKNYDKAANRALSFGRISV
jgi:hypothetical protein